MESESRSECAVRLRTGDSEMASAVLAGILQAQSLAVSQGCLVFVVRLRLRRRGPVQRLVYLGWDCVSFSFGSLSSVGFRSTSARTSSSTRECSRVRGRRCREIE